MNNKNQEIYLINALRTPVGKLFGALSDYRPDDLAAKLIQKMLHNLPLKDIWPDALILGCANQAGEDNRNIARMAALLSGIPYHVPAISLNSLCTSGLDAIIDAARRIRLGEGHFYIAGAVESMSRSPFVTSRTHQHQEDSLIGWRFVNPAMQSVAAPLQMSQTAELLAKKYQISRSSQDDYAYQSRSKYQLAVESNNYTAEIMPLFDKKGTLLKLDEQHRMLSKELLAKLPLLHKDGACISSGNAARLGDGAAVVALASADFVRRHQLPVMARIQAWANAATHPSEMSLSAVAASQKLLQQQQLPIDAVNCLEISESFAVQALVCTQQLGIDPSLVNCQGGALTIGNPLSVSSARLIVHLAHQMQQYKQLNYSMAAACAGMGTGSAVLLKAAHSVF